MKIQDSSTKGLTPPLEPGYVIYTEGKNEVVLPKAIRELFVWNDIVRSIAVKLKDDNAKVATAGGVGDANHMTLCHLCDIVGDRYTEEVGQKFIDWQEAAIALFQLMQRAESLKDLKMLAKRNQILRYDVNNDCFFPNKK